MRQIAVSFFAYFSFISTYSQIITTIAGNGIWGYSGDGGPATQAQLSSPHNSGVAIDMTGNVYISDFQNNVIRKVNSSGIISTIAGSGVLGYAGDGGLATAAQLYHPSAIIIDRQDNIIFSDQNGDVLRKINSSGVITTLAGFPGNTACSGDGGPVSNALFNVTGLALDNSGNIYVSDAHCNTVRKVDIAGIVTTVAGNGIRGSSGDGGLAINAQLNGPCQVGVDNYGNIYIPEFDGKRIRKIDPTGIITTVAGNGTSGYSGDNGSALQAQFSFPAGACCDGNGNIYVADLANLVVRKIDASGIITTFAGNETWGYSGDGGSASMAQLTSVVNVNSDSAGNIYITDANGTIRMVNNCKTASFTQQPVSVSLCNSGNASFTISAGNYNSLQWQVNTGTGWSDINDGGIYSGTNNTLLSITGATIAMNNYEYRCLAKNGCGNLSSEMAVLKINTPQSPNISITASSPSICEGTKVNFNASYVNSGSSPVLTWQKNGYPVGTNAVAYVATDLKNGDVITCTLSSNGGCISSSTANSNSIIMIVQPMLTAAISIVESSNNICSGNIVTFNATVNNGGSAPNYQWHKNGLIVGTNNAFYSDNALSDQDVVECTLTSNYGCLSTSSALSNAIKMHVDPLVSPDITISSSATAVCPGSSISFAASAYNTGATPVYEWSKNGVVVGTNSPSYSDNIFSDGDIVKCKIISNASCLASASVTSNPIPITVYKNPIVYLDHTPTLCTGSIRRLDAGNFSSYRWNDGSTDRYFSINAPGSYYVVVTDNNSCKGSDTTTISTLLPRPSGFLPGDTSICSYGSLKLQPLEVFKSYSWNTSASTSSITITSPGIYWLEVIDNNQCRGRDSIVVSPKECLKGLYVPTAFTPNGDGKNDVFRPFVFGKLKHYSLTIYNRWGAIVFQTQDLQSGWNGLVKNKPQESNVFVWVCIYQFDNEAIKTEKGSFILVR